MLRTGEAVRFERELVSIGRTVDVLALPVNDATQRRIAVVLSDITARNRAEGALRESRAELERQEQFHDATLSNVDDIIYMWDRANRFVYGNRALERVWGLTRDEFAGKTPAELSYPPDLCHLFARQIEHVFVTRETVTGEIPYTSPLGEFGYFAYVLNPVTGATDDVEYVVGVSRDVTERRRAEAEREHLLQEVNTERARQAFLLGLSDALRPIADPGEIQAAALNLLGEHLGVDRAFYAEIVSDGGVDYYRLDRDYRTPRTPSIVGRYPVSAFGRVVTDTYRAGHW
ncbi:MAG: PAS domain S-box protein, partial [Chloroflexota bacterium]|nr:PAS domain S-box protein [Chloroflexota bacterium]